MALQQNNVTYLDDWNDLKEYTKKKAESVEKEKDNRDVTKDYVGEQIDEYAQEDAAREAADISALYKKIEDISAGGGVDLTPYLKKDDAAQIYATKSEIPSVDDYVTQEQMTAALEDKATIAQVAAVDQKVDAIVIPDTSNFATKADVSALAEQIPSVDGFATQEQLAEAVSDKATIAQVAAVDQKVDAIVIPDVSNLATKDEVAAVVAQIPSIEGLATQEQLTEAISDKATISQVAAVDQKVDAIVIPDVSNLATKEEVAAVAAQIPSIESLATTEYVNSEIARVEEEIPDVSNLATKDEVTAVAAQIPDVSNFVTEETVDEKIATEIAKVVADAPEDFDTLKEVADYISSDKTRAAEIETAISNLQNDKADSSSVYTKEQADAKFLTEHQDISGFATKQEMEAGDTSVLNNVLSKMWNKGSDCFYTKKVMNGKTALIFNESDGGGSIFETNDTKSFVGVNDGGDLSTGVHVQIYSKTKTDNKGARLNVNPSGIFYGVGTSASTDPESELAVKGDIPSIEGLATTEQLAGAVETINSSLEQKATYTYVSEAIETLEEAINQVLDEKANIVDVSAAIVDVETSIETKADAESVPTKTEFEALKGQFEELKQLVYEYAPGSEQEAIADGEIADLSPDNKSVHVDEPMKSVVLPESTGTLYTVEVPLRDESSVELTSPKTATIANTSDEPVNTAFSAPEPTGSSNTKIYLSGLFEDIELTNVNIDKSSSYDAAIISGNVTITEANTNPVTVAAEFSNGCIVKNDSNCDVTLNNKSAVGSSVTVLAPGSTVTIQGGQWEEFESTVGEDTLYINSAAHLKKLIINKGNCVVNSYDVSNCVDEVVNETEYTVIPRVIEVTTKTEWNKASSTDALYEVQNDISTNIRIAPGIFGSQAKMKLNGHTVTCTDANGAFVLRGSSHYIVENGTINASGYGIWLAGSGTVELKDLHIIADSHALYIEKTGGNIYTTGNCRFEVSNDDKRYVANYLDATYTGGWTHGFHFGENTEFVDFDPAASMGEVGGPVNLLDEGYHTESYAEGVHTIYKVVKDNE